MRPATLSPGRTGGRRPRGPHHHRSGGCRVSDVDGLPDYEPLLAAYHHAFAPELKAMIDALPIREGDSVLEVACGDGAYTPWLAGRVGASGRVLAFDLLAAYVRGASRGA